MLCRLLSRIRVFAMHIARAYCVEADRVVDIYQARALFFALDEPRRRFQFLCSDDACRVANATRVTGVNYDKLVEDERDRVVVKPHFRMNQETPHSTECEWLVRERICGASTRRPPNRNCAGVRMASGILSSVTSLTSSRQAARRHRQRSLKVDRIIRRGFVESEGKRS